MSGLLTGTTGSFTTVRSSGDLVYSGSNSLISQLASINTSLGQKQPIPNNSAIYEWTSVSTPVYNTLMLSHPSGIQFAVTGFIPADISTVYLTVDTTGITTTSGNILSNLAVGGVSSFSGNMTCQQITANGDLIFGSYAQVNTLRFNCGNNSYNRIVVDPFNSYIMYFYSNNTNWLRSDGTTTIFYSDVNIFTNSASGVKRLTVESQGTSGTPYITLKARNTSQASLYLTNTAFNVASETSGVPITFQTNNAGTTISPVSIYANGVMSVGGNTIVNKVLAIYDPGSSDTPSTATNFYGFGVNTLVLRYQVPQTSHSHKFYCSTTNAFIINNTGGANASDSRWKTDVQNITDALDKIGQLQGKTFVLNDSPQRQMGFIAQEVELVCPEVVVIEDSEDHFRFMQYDKLTALLCEGIKEQQALITTLTSRVASLEARLTALEGNPI